MSEQGLVIGKGPDLRDIVGRDIQGVHWLDHMPMIIVVDKWLLFPGGYARPMTLLERWKHWRGKLVIPIERG